MNRQKLILSTVAVFTIGVAFAAQTKSVRFERHAEDVQQREPWVPGTNMLMSAHETGVAPLAPPR